MNQDPHKHISGDRYLTILSQGEDVVSTLVRSFPGTRAAQVDPTWLDQWFASRVQHFYVNSQAEPPGQIHPPQALAELVDLAQGIVSTPFKLTEIHPHFFRGFRSHGSRITLPDGLVVIDGPNSSGKTSLAEAFEWLFTGELVRRTLHGQGAPKELENCICNQLCPQGEEIFVEATLRLDTGDIIVLRRVLTADYGASSTSKPSSKLYKDGHELTPPEETALLDTLALGIPPMLTQHSLRVFVQSSPAQRRDYFETLLRLDELTYLIERAVVGDARLPEFRSPTGGVALAKWEVLKGVCHQRASKTALTRAERTAPQELRETIAHALLAAGKSEFAELLQEINFLDHAITTVASKQRGQRQKTFPILSALRPRRALDEQLLELLSTEELTRRLTSIRESATALQAAEQAAKHISEAEIAVSAAFHTLEQAGLVSKASQAQRCPICAYRPIATLTADRICLIHSWAPAREAIAHAKLTLSSHVSSFRELVARIKDARLALLPPAPQKAIWDQALLAAPPAVSGPAVQLRQKATTAQQALSVLDTAFAQIDVAIAGPQLDTKQLTSAEDAVQSLSQKIPCLIQESREYAQVFATLDAAVGTLSRQDPGYGSRETWLNVTSDQDNLAIDMAWEQAKRKAQNELAVSRDTLIQSRQSILDARRDQFSQGMTDIWRELREDKYSAFSRLLIPAPRTKGYPVEIEVKAILDDGTQQLEVDALRVFSESQVHALGIAAFLTRGRLLGHRCIILDDPVQSMDEDHFRTFASALLPYLLTQGLQVIVLTHNDTFSRDVSHQFSDADHYTTFTIRHSRRKGCQVEEGNRRAAERLKRAESLGEDGKLEEAWRLVRLAVERIYLCAMIKNGPRDFDPRSWNSQTAEYMWDTGSGEIICAIIPDAAPRLKDILEMTAAGAHDKHPRGQTDLAAAIRYLRQVMNVTRLGSA